MTSPCPEEVVAQRLHDMGLVCPSEKTAADIASAIAVIKYGVAAIGLQPSDVKATFEWIKARRCVNSRCIYDICIHI